MAKDNEASDGLAPNPLVSELLESNADSSVMLRGFPALAGRSDFVRLFPNLDEMWRSIEIAEADILKSAKLPKSELGAVAIWVSRDAELHHHIIETASAWSERNRACLTEASRGGLKMKTRAMARDTCTCEYYCDGTRCVPCTSNCVCTC